MQFIGGALDRYATKGQSRWSSTEKYLGCKPRLKEAVNDRTGIEPVK